MTAVAPGRPAPVPERIVVITTSYPAFAGDPSGHFVAAEVSALRAEGHDVTVIAPRPASAPGQGQGVRWLEGGTAFGWPGVISRLRERPLRAVSAFGFVLRARRALSREVNVDRVVAHLQGSSASCRPVKRSHRSESGTTERSGHGW